MASAAEWTTISSKSNGVAYNRLTDSQWALVRYLKSKMADQSLSFGVPKKFFPFGNYPVRSCTGLIHATSTLDLPSLASLMCGALVASSPDPPRDLRDYVCFRVVVPYPEQKTIVRGAHLGHSRSTVLMAMQELVQSGDTCELHDFAQHTTSLDLMHFASVQVHLCPGPYSRLWLSTQPCRSIVALLQLANVGP